MENICFMAAFIGLNFVNAVGVLMFALLLLSAFVPFFSKDLNEIENENDENK